jgi:F-box/leucine-rich repeat protein 10/11
MLLSWSGENGWWTSLVSSLFPLNKPWPFPLSGIELTVDVATQQSSQWTLNQWAEYVKTSTDPENRPNKVYNIISLEVTGTELAKKVRPPTLVREIDWVDNFWHFGPGGKNAAVQASQNPVVDDKAAAANGQTVEDAFGQEVEKKKKKTSLWPKVQLYCLVSSSPGINRVDPSPTS